MLLLLSLMECLPVCPYAPPCHSVPGGGQRACHSLHTAPPRASRTPPWVSAAVWSAHCLISTQWAPRTSLFHGCFLLPCGLGCLPVRTRRIQHLTMIMHPRVDQAGTCVNLAAKHLISFGMSFFHFVSATHKSIVDMLPLSACRNSFEFPNFFWSASTSAGTPVSSSCSTKVSMDPLPCKAWINLFHFRWLIFHR